jgi:hypothetical protein
MHLFDFFRRMLPFPPPEVPLTVDTDSLAKTVAKKILPTPTAKKNKPAPAPKPIRKPRAKKPTVKKSLPVAAKKKPGAKKK